jgi:hypothetical protein
MLCFEPLRKLFFKFVKVERKSFAKVRSYDSLLYILQLKGICLLQLRESYYAKERAKVKVHFAGGSPVSLANIIK